LIIGTITSSLSKLRSEAFIRFRRPGALNAGEWCTMDIRIAPHSGFGSRASIERTAKARAVHDS
jgi:hypothetical protein